MPPTSRTCTPIDVSTKFIQHFKVTRWVNNPLLTADNGNAAAVSDPNTNNGNEQITLKGFQRQRCSSLPWFQRHL